MEFVFFFGGRLLFNFSSYFTMVYFSNIFLTRNNYNLKKHIVWIVSYSILAFLASSYYYNSGLLFYPEIISLIFLVIYIYTFYTNKKLEKFFVLSSLMLSFYTLEIILEYLMLTLTNTITINYSYRLMLLIVRFTIIAIYHFLFENGSLKTNLKIDGFYKKQIIAFSFMLLTCFLYALLFDKIIINNLTSIVFLQFFKIVTLIVLMLFSFGSLFIVGRYNNEKLLEYSNKLSSEQLKLQLNHYKTLESSLEETRRIKHDMKNHVICLKYLASKKDYSHIESYLDDIENSIDIINTGIYSGNNVVDAIINQKLKLAEENKIQFDIKATLPTDSFIQSIDICAIVSNSIDNAIEACQRSDYLKKNITLESHINKNYWIYKLKNTSNKVIINNNSIKTSKSDTLNHGHGLKNIFQSVKKYDGDINLLYQDDTFSISIILPIN